MSHNPMRAESQRNLHQRPTPAPRPRMHTAAPPARQPAGDKVLTAHGHTIKLFENEQFCVRYETMHARNSTGVGVATGDRVILVTHGKLFVQLKNPEGKFDLLSVQDGQHVNLVAGSEYALATGGDLGVDFQVTETTGYQDGWQQLEKPTVGAAVAAVQGIQSAPTVVRRGVDTKTMEHAEQLQTEGLERRRRAAQRGNEFAPPGNANSTNVIGVNPKPGGIPKEE